MFWIISQSLAMRQDSTLARGIIQRAWLPASITFLIIKHGEPLKRRKFNRFFAYERMWGIDGKLPVYMYSIKVGRYLKCYRFKSKLHPYEWEKAHREIEMLFKRKIYKFNSNRRDVCIMDIYVIKEDLPNYIKWSDSYLVEGRKFAIGESYGKKEVWNAEELPHGLIAGATGTGKTGLIRNIVHQAIQKRFNVYVLDFKGCGDFNSVEREYEKHHDLTKDYGRIIISEPVRAQEILLALIVEVRDRMEKFKECGVANIDEFNTQKGNNTMRPWLTIVDEVAEVLDVKPKDKADKEMYVDIEKSLRTLARMSRAAGVHLLLGMIRPSHDVLDGQIKNNLLFRACGYFSDASASRIVLDNDKATELPPDIKGRFIIGEEEVQAYYLPIPTEE